MQAIRKEELFKAPGVAETLDWAAALVELDAVALDPALVSDTLGVLLKYQDDIQKMQGSQGEGAPRRRPRRSAGGGMTGRERKPSPPQGGEGRAAPALLPRTSPISRARCVPPDCRSGPGAVLDALAAVEAARIGTRDDFYWTLHAVFVKRHEHSILFDQAFRIFWRRRATLEQLLGQMLPARRARRPRSRSPAPPASPTRSTRRGARRGSRGRRSSSPPASPCRTERC